MKWLKIAGIVLCVVALLLAGAITFTIGWRPFIGPRARPVTDRKFEVTAERLARGKYLTENVLDCFACHSQRDWSKRDAPSFPGPKAVAKVPFHLRICPARSIRQISRRTRKLARATGPTINWPALSAKASAMTVALCFP